MMFILELVLKAKVKFNILKFLYGASSRKNRVNGVVKKQLMAYFYYEWVKKISLMIKMYDAIPESKVVTLCILSEFCVEVVDSNNDREKRRMMKKCRFLFKKIDEMYLDCKSLNELTDLDYVMIRKSEENMAKFI
ncbi:hypothetical protein L1267_22805 [Pseudoalteromonas sp. OFAV1]|jgi:hypothetical protein|uniref:hypothetical protein n=1 Tax=Pseudoalteromonas sp. OFAV1 TaxID=2908892 RepID=UPI001F247573|nr:hypothetical protein [Pseudoalteromonas sp. OFAV1]MCF2903203.1 hypothetical protein [Pseudoalteromonas sp. OFAV1]